MIKRLGLKVVLAVILATTVYLTGCSAPVEQQPDSNSEQKSGIGTEKPSSGQQTVDEGQKTVKEVKNYFPLSKDSSWQYKGEGNEYASFVTTVLHTKGNRAQISKDNGGTVSTTVFEISDKAVTKVFFQGETYDGTDFLDQQANQNTIILKAPLEVGTKWQDPDGTREIVDVEAVVDTPAGKFEQCIKVKIENADSTVYEYYKDGVGLVKQEFISGDTVVTSLLEKYTIK